VGKWTIVLIAGLSVGSVAMGQDPPVDDAAKRADALRLTEATHVRQRAGSMADSMIAMLQKTRPDVGPAAWADVRGAIVDEIVGQTVELLAEDLSDEDIKALIAFYEAPLGRKAVDVEDKIAAEAEARAPEMQKRIVAKMTERLQAAGHGSPTAGPAQGPVHVGGTIREPRKIKNVNPVYPDAAKEAGIQGVVIMECTIRPDGTVGQAKVVRSAAPLLDDAAVKAVRQWAYTPTLLNGVPVPVIMTVTVNFRLSSN
jgi:TonB family protein